MHILQVKDAEREFDDLIEKLDEIGPVVVQEDGAAVGVMISLPITPGSSQRKTLTTDDYAK